MRIYSFITLFIHAISSYGQSEIKQTSLSKPFVLGTCDEIYSKELSEKRTINIYIPEGYDEKDTIAYPVVYLLDGGVDEDFIHVVGLYQFNSFPWIHRVPRSFIIGISNADRQRDFTYPTTNLKDQKRYPTSGHSEQFINFIEKEVQPYIQKKYKTKDSKTIIGQSLGGLLATEILFRRPYLFNQYIIISPSLWWDNGSLLNLPSVVFEKKFTFTTEVYIGVGKEGLTPGDYPRVEEVDANVLAEKLKMTESKVLNVYFDYLPQEDHATVSHQAIFNALRMLYPPKEKQ